MTPCQWKVWLRQRAEALGFDLFGVARAGPAQTIDAYRRWVERGFAGGMTYLTRADRIERRADPRAILPSARSVVVVGMNYYTGDHPPCRSPTTGRIARYAWGEDYHRLMERRLRALLRAVQEKDPSVEGRYYVDHGPVLEREWAARAGLGWVGKHTNVLSRQWGNWFFLGVLLLSLEVEADEPLAKSYCGTCTRCLEACPTGALLAPYVLDARRCISYLTIEWRGLIPREWRPLIGDRIFGCDDCLEVCSWNRFARRAREAAFRPRPGWEAPNLREWMKMDEAAFAERFRGSPIRRIRRAGLLRNVAVALGNSGDPCAVPPLVEALHRDPEPLVRGHAAWALGRLATAEAHRALREAQRKEQDPYVREEIEAARAGEAPAPKPETEKPRRSQGVDP
jgi:epoxyqueuosine reductase